MVMVAALNVGHISLNVGNCHFKSAEFGAYQVRYFKQPLVLQQGDHVATFLLGATVILLCQAKKATHDFQVDVGDTISIGQPLLLPSFN